MSRVLPLYLRLVRLHARLLLVIGVGVAAFETFMVWFSAQMDTGESLESVLEMVMPPEMRAVLFDQFGVGTFEGAVAFGFQHPIFLVAVIAFMIVTATVPAAERETGFLDLVLARPVPRWAYLLATLLLMVTGALLLPVFILVGAAIGLTTAEAVPAAMTWATFIPAGVAQSLLLMAAGGIALLAATGARRRGPAVGLAVGILLVFYWLDFLGPIWDVLEAVRWGSLFSYFDPARAVAEGLSGRDALVMGGTAVVTIVAAFGVFGRQDL